MSDYHVTLYSGPETEELECARNFLKSRQIQYEEKSILDPGARGELKHHTHKWEYPAINVNGHFVSGFFREKWEHLLLPGGVKRT
ncbi:MAG TPA: NrdH-redoxin [Symbiobacteriaceae bacterium]|nr:NrdH-redoxin [Symbiobacteriaceae bacterium]